MRIEIIPYQLHFLREARTSRNTMLNRDIWLVQVFDDSEEMYGIGECAPIFGLSQESKEQVENALYKLKLGHKPDLNSEEWKMVPSVVMAYEMAIADLMNGGRRIYFGTGQFEPIPINGLVWMNERDTMLREAFEKIDAGYTTIKLKVGSLDFNEELSILESIRSKFGPEQITIRLDANGAFTAENVFQKLEALSKYAIHSIEQPVKAGQWPLMQQICAANVIPIALDEELIGINDFQKKRTLLQTIQPQYIILKPSLHGGFEGSDEWIKIASELDIPWWATSALESSFGLLAIAQWVSQYNVKLPQGLGTGSLYANNFESSLLVKNGFLHLLGHHSIKLPKWD